MFAWDLHGPFYGPIKPKKAVKKRALGQTRLQTPLSKGLGFPIVSYEVVLSRVVVLLCSGCPFTVCRTITLIIINSFYRHPLWPFAHILQKVLEFKPSVTNGDSSTTVVGVCVVVAIHATIFKFKPRFIRPRL